jgi:hypothetical protein
MSRFLRRTTLLAALALARVGGLSTPASAAQPAPSGHRNGLFELYTTIPSLPECSSRTNDFRVTVVSCLYVTGGRMHGYVGLDFLSGFNREGVLDCTVYLQLVSSYGSKSPDLPVDCDGVAHEGKMRWYSVHFDIDWGPGRGLGTDDYSQYAWVDVQTGNTYLGRAFAAKKTIRL